MAEDARGAVAELFTEQTGELDGLVDRAWTNQDSPSHRVGGQMKRRALVLAVSRR